MDVQKVIRRLATGSVATIFAMVVIGPGGDFFSELARENGLYSQPTRRVQALIGWVSELVSSQPFGWIAGVVIGFALGVWVDAYLRHREVSAPPNPVADTSPTAPQEASPPPAPVFDIVQAIARRDRLSKTIPALEDVLRSSREQLDRWLELSRDKVYGSGLQFGNFRTYEAAFSDWLRDTGRALADLDWPTEDRAGLARERGDRPKAPNDGNFYDYEGKVRDPVRRADHRSKYWQAMDTFEAIEGVLARLHAEDARLAGAIRRASDGEKPNV